MCIIELAEKCCRGQGAHLVPCEDLEDGMEGNWEGNSGEGDVCLLKADSHCCTAEIDTTL